MNEIILIPVKSFALAKARLAEILDADTREQLAICLAEIVCLESGGLPVCIVCEDDDVASWAASKNLMISRNPGVGLNQSLQLAANWAASTGYSRISLVHSDLPFAKSIGQACKDLSENQALLIPDSKLDGTNFLSIPACALRPDPSKKPGRTGFVFSYGAGSFTRHMEQANQLYLSPLVRKESDLAFDLDTPQDWERLVARRSEVTSPRLRLLIESTPASL
jgi:2-phospho-L-lactate guanylyltransferase